MFGQGKLALAGFDFILDFLYITYSLCHVELNFYHRNQALVVGTCHQLEEFEFIYARNRQWFASLVNLSDHALYFVDISF